MKVRLVAVLSVFALGSSASLANMLLLGAGGGSGGGGGGPTTVYACSAPGTDYGTYTASLSAEDGDGYRTMTMSGAWGGVYVPAAEQAVSTSTTYTATMEIKNTGSISYIGVLFGDSSWTNRFSAIFQVSNGAYQGGGGGGGGSFSSYTTTDLTGGKYRLTITGSSSAWGGGKAALWVHACTDSACSDSPASGTIVVNTNTCKITTP